MKLLTTFTAFLGLCAGAAACGLDPVEPDEPIASRQDPITDGQLCNGHPEVGLLRVGASVCTATLVGRRTVITAAHCALAGPGTLALDGKPYAVEKVVLHPDWDPKTLGNDLAVLRLAAEPGVAPASVTRQAPRKGLDVQLVGFGISGDKAKDGFVKRLAENRVADLERMRFTVAGTGSGAGNICHGDSGGPAFAEHDGEEQLIGVASGGIQPCGTVAYFTRVDAYLPWLSVSCEGDLELAPPSTRESGDPNVASGGGAGLETLAAKTGGCAVIGAARRPAELADALLLVLLLALSARPQCLGRRVRSFMDSVCSRPRPRARTR